MSVVVVKQPKEKERVLRGWRTKVIQAVAVRGRWVLGKREIRENRKELEAEHARRSAHNYLLLRELGAKAPYERIGVLDRLKGFFGSVFSGKK